MSRPTLRCFLACPNMQQRGLCFSEHHNSLRLLLSHFPPTSSTMATPQNFMFLNPAANASYESTAWLSEVSDTVEDQPGPGRRLNQFTGWLGRKVEAAAGRVFAILLKESCERDLWWFSVEERNMLLRSRQGTNQISDNCDSGFLVASQILH